MLKKRIPTIIGLLLLILGTIGGVLFINKGTDFLPRAAPEYAPQKVKITNLSESGFVVSWITEEPTIGFIRFGKSANALSTTVTDDRDQLAGAAGDYRSHYITIQNLTPATTYYFKLGSQKNQLYDNSGQPFAITVPTALSSAPEADTVYGTVVTAANTPAEGAIVYFTVAGAAPISALVKQNGGYATNLSTARTTDLNGYITYDANNTRIDILVQPSSGSPANAITTTNNDQPVPTITLGQTQDFTRQEAVVTPPTPEPTVMPTPLDTVMNTAPTPIPDTVPDAEPISRLTLQQIDAAVPDDKSLSFSTLLTDGVEINSLQPEIKGKAPANSTLIISMHSIASYTDQVKVDAAGKWQWTPPSNLEPGEHTVTISYIDTDGLMHKLSRLFIVNAAGNAADGGAIEPSYSATPSATVVPKPTATPKPTSEPATPKPTPRTNIATESADLRPGTTSTTFYLLLMGSILLTFGWKLLLPRR